MTTLPFEVDNPPRDLVAPCRCVMCDVIYTLTPYRIASAWLGIEQLCCPECGFPTYLKDPAHVFYVSEAEFEENPGTWSLYRLGIVFFANPAIKE